MQRRDFLAMLSLAPCVGAVESKAAPSPRTKTRPQKRFWQSRPPRGCPFDSSSIIKEIEFTGRYASYENADTWFPSWASDGNLYSPFTDGTVGGVEVHSGGLHASTGHAKIVGDDPLQLTVVPLGVHAGSPWPYGGRYPSASLVHDGMWYYGTYCVDQKNPHLNWDVLGPFVGFRISRDYGASWSDPSCTPANPLFLENGKNGAKVKLGALHFVDFGKNMQHSPDGKAYLVGHGATRSDAELSWISGDQIYMVRVEATPENINDLGKYEFFAGQKADGAPRWSSDFDEIRPLLEWNDRTGVVTVTYNAPLKRYFMFVTDGFPTIARMNTYVLESADITGPWRLITFMNGFGEQGYFVNLPTKFISEDGRSGWLLYSANFTSGYKADPEGGGYALTLHEVRFLL